MRDLLADNEKINAASALFRLLGDPTRLKILLSCLLEAKSVSDVAAAVGITGSLTSHHLRLLRGADLVQARRQGRQVFYRAANENVNTLLAGLLAEARRR